MPNQRSVFFLLASDFPTENPRTQKRTFHTLNIGINLNKLTTK